jgi:hypothetical protein
MPTTSDTPPVLPAGVSSVAEIEGNWVTVRVKHQHEKAVAWELAERGVGYYLPMGQHVRDYDKVRVTIHKPVFERHVFACPRTDDERSAVSEIRKVTELLAFPSDALRGDLIRYETMTPFNPALVEWRWAVSGESCRVSHGSFQGMEGIIITANLAKPKFVVQLKTLGQAVMVEIPRHCLERAA